jgi:hypothetical protein
VIQRSLGATTPYCLILSSMATLRPNFNRTQPPTRRIFGSNELAFRVHDDSPAVSTDQSNRRAVSFDHQQPKSNFTSHRRTSRDDSEEIPPPTLLERPPIPSALTKAAETDSTPLPILSMIVLSIVNRAFSESLCVCELSNALSRRCLGSFYQPMYLHLSCYSWSRACSCLVSLGVHAYRPC